MTPIKRMVDEACGVKQPAGKIRSNNIDEAGKRLKAVGDAAKAWWEAGRPAAWTEDEHCERPAVNCVTEAERNLAVAVGRLVELGW
jgi:hypothetical protein